MRALLRLKPHVQSTLIARTRSHGCIRHACVPGSHAAFIAVPRLLTHSSNLTRIFAVLHAFAIYQGIEPACVALRHLPAPVTPQAMPSATILLRAISSSAAETSAQTMLDLSDKDESLTKLFLAASSHQWHLLPGRCLWSARVSDACQTAQSRITK